MPFLGAIPFEILRGGGAEMEKFVPGLEGVYPTFFGTKDVLQIDFWVIWSPKTHSFKKMVFILLSHFCKKHRDEEFRVSGNTTKCSNFYTNYTNWALRYLKHTNCRSAPKNYLCVLGTREPNKELRLTFRIRA